MDRHVEAMRTMLNLSRHAGATAKNVDRGMAKAGFTKEEIEAAADNLIGASLANAADRMLGFTPTKTLDNDLFGHGVPE